MSSELKIGQDSSNRHACHCGKSFARKEHLTRHQAIHKKTAYSCDVCQRQFSRRDLLRRHTIVHGPGRSRIAVSCDACRANKTKCSGGPRCSLCVKRGIDCVFQSNLRQPTEADIDLSTNAAPHGTDRGNKDSTLLQNSDQSSLLAEESSVPEAHDIFNQDWLSHLTIAPSKPAPIGEIRPVNTGIAAVHELLLAESSSLEWATRESDDLQHWLDGCVETFFQAFHLSWPILNAPSWDTTTASLHLSATVCAMGTWLEEDPRSKEGRIALHIHDALLQRLLQRLMEPDVLSKNQPWPLELFQAILLNLIFSLHRKDKTAVSRATFLRSVFITTLRELGSFQGDTLADHLKAHFSGSFVPYTMSTREQFTRLLALTYQFDVYFALVHQTPPLLHPQEVSVGLTSTFALWNSHGLDIFAQRLKEEPVERFKCQISTMTDCPESLTTPLFVEDVILGLCGLLQEIWVLRQSADPTSKESTGKAFLRFAFIETINSWTHQLDKIMDLASTTNITSARAKYLLLAYRGKDASATTISNRIATLVLEGRVLSHCLRMFHYSKISSSKFVCQSKPIENSSKRVWQTTKHGRDALVCALQMLEIMESEETYTLLNPLIEQGLAMGAELTRRVLVSSETCPYTVGEHSNAPSLDLSKWIEVGGPRSIMGIPVCACSLHFWTQRWEKAVEHRHFRRKLIR